MSLPTDLEATPLPLTSTYPPTYLSHTQQIEDHEDEFGEYYNLSSSLAPTPRQTLRICLNLKYLIDKVIPIQYSKSDVIAPDSSIITNQVIQLVYEAAGGEGYGSPGSTSRKYRSVLVFALLKVTGWYGELAEVELHHSELYQLRALAAQYLAKIIIERENNTRYLFHMLTHKFVVNLNLVDSEACNVLELAVDMHSTSVISSSGFQRCIKWLWRGWIVQSPANPSCYVIYRDSCINSFRVHFDPNRIKTPLYQNMLEVFFSVIYLGLYSFIVNQTEKKMQPLGFFEAGFFLFTVSYILDELIKFYHIGFAAVQSFWNVFNDTMYAIISSAMVLRFIALNSKDPGFALENDRTSFRLLALVAPFMWIRLMLFLDVERFIGVMIVIIKVMMKESIIFFFLLITVITGFLQGFLGLDSSDGTRTSTYLIITELLKGILGGGDFNSFNHFVYPYSSILYYSYNFLIQVILINILVALFSSAYSKIYSNSLEEYMALYTQKVLRYSRAPDAQVYVPPFNIIEILISPLQFVLSQRQFNYLNYYIMLIIYAPFLVYTSITECRTARKVSYNRLKGLSDDANEYDRAWDLTDGFVDSAHQDNVEHVQRDLTEQQRAEAADPSFSVGKSWLDNVNKAGKGDGDKDQGLDEKVEKLTQIVERGRNVKELSEKVDKLTDLVEKLVEQKQ